MNAELIRVYEAIETKERSLVGRGPMTPPSEGKDASLGFFLTDAEARTAAEGRGAWGNNGTVQKRDDVRMENGEVYVLASATPVKVYATGKDAIVERALAKLEPHERAALGFPRM